VHEVAVPEQVSHKGSHGAHRLLEFRKEPLTHPEQVEASDEQAVQPGGQGRQLVVALSAI